MAVVDVSTTSSESERVAKPRSLAWDEVSDTERDDCGTEWQRPGRQRRRRGGGRPKPREINASPSTPKAAATLGDAPSVLELFGLTPKASERRANLHASSPIAHANAALTPPAARHLQSHNMVCVPPPAAEEFWCGPGESGAWVPAPPLPQAAGAPWSYVPAGTHHMQTAFGTAPARPRAGTEADASARWQAEPSPPWPPGPEAHAEIAADARSHWQAEPSDFATWCCPDSPMSPKEQEALLQNLMPDVYEE